MLELGAKKSHTTFIMILIPAITVLTTVPVLTNVYTSQLRREFVYVKSANILQLHQCQLGRENKNKNIRYSLLVSDKNKTLYQSGVG